jgi:hypothetical protein
MLAKDKVLCKTNSVQNKHNLYYVKDSTLVRLPPSEDTFKQHVLSSSYQTKIWLIAHIPKPAVRSPLAHGCKDGKFGLEPILFEGLINKNTLLDILNV